MSYQWSKLSNLFKPFQSLSLGSHSPRSLMAPDYSLKVSSLWVDKSRHYPIPPLSILIISYISKPVFDISPKLQTFSSCLLSILTWIWADTKKQNSSPRSSPSFIFVNGNTISLGTEFKTSQAFCLERILSYSPSFHKGPWQYATSHWQRG